MSTQPIGSSVELMIRRVTLTFDAGRFRDVIDQARIGLSHDPDVGFFWKAMGSALWKEGMIDEAIIALGRALRLDTYDSHAWVNRAIALQESGRTEEALANYGCSLAIEPGNASTSSNLGITLDSLGRSDDAQRSWRRALQLDPNDAGAWINLGNLHGSAGRGTEGLGCYHRALCVSPSSGQSASNLGVSLQKARRLAESLQWQSRAVQLTTNEASSLGNLGSCLLELKNFEKSIAVLSRALVLQPTNLNCLNSLAVAFRGARKIDDALREIERSIRLRPDDAAALDCRGTALREAELHASGLLCHQAALALDPTLKEGLTNLGTALLQLRRVDAAIACYERAFALDPTNYSALWNASLACLAQADFRKGWQFHEYRFVSGAVSQSKVEGIPEFSRRLHLGRRVLVTAEQGVGDELMFGSMIGDFSKLCGEIVIQTDERLVPLFRRSFPTNVTVVSSSRAVNAATIDAQVSIGSLGMHVRQSTQEFFEKNKGYLIANSEKTRYFFDHLSAGRKKPLVGLSWQSTNPDSAAKRNIDVRQLCAAVRKALPEANLVSLQYGVVEAEIGGVFDDGACELLRCPDLDLTRDLDGVAALISACDVVLTIGNTTAHLAGALGKKAVVLLPFAPSWRWMVDGDFTPWYETLKLHRKAAPDSAWSDVIDMAMRSLVSCISPSGTRSI